MSDPKPQTFEEWLASSEGPPVHADSYEGALVQRAWNAAQAALRAEMEQERAVAVATAEEAFLRGIFDEHSGRYSMLLLCSRNIATGELEEGPVIADIVSVHSDSGALARTLDQARAEATKAVQASLEGQARETARIAAREKALRERLDPLAEQMLGVGPCEHHGRCNIGAEGCTYDLRDFAAQVREILEETKGTDTFAHALERARAESSLREAEWWVSLVPEEDAPQAEERLAKLRAILDETK